jgi:hypothetical protein
MAKNSKCTGSEKTSEKRDIKFLSFKSFKPTYQHLAAFVFVPSVFGEKFTTAEF